MGEKDPIGEKPPEKPAEAPPESSGVKVGGSRDIKKYDGPKGEKTWGNRKPEPKDPNAPKKGPGQEK